MCYCSSFWTVNLLRGFLTTFSTCMDHDDNNNAEAFQTLPSTTESTVFLFLCLWASLSAPTLVGNVICVPSALPLAPLTWLLQDLLLPEPPPTPIRQWLAPAQSSQSLVLEEFSTWRPPISDAGDPWTSSGTATSFPFK